jgi:hypothetical protein
MFVDRESKQSKGGIQKLIIDRQRLSEEDENYDPLIIHAEGGTSNGESVIQFKKGAFVGLYSI